MPPDEDLKKRVARKLTKRRKEGHQVTIEMPERFRDGDDVDDDCTALSGPNAYINQSVFGMIAAAGSQVDFNARFDDQSSDEEDPVHASNASVGKAAAGTKGDRPKLPKHGPTKNAPRSTSSSRPGSKSASKLVSPTAGSPSGSTAPTLSLQPSNNESVLKRMLEAQAELSTSLGSDMPRLAKEGANNTEDGASDCLARRLMEIFGLESPEPVVSEHPCWLLQSVLLQGYLYVTNKHICFYAYLPKRSNEVVKSGYLSKSGRRNPKYNRYWFRLKGDVLAYYSDPSDLYFPSGNIDLRYGISASVVDKDKGKDGTHFTVVTNQRQYHFKADSLPSAKEWVKALQKIIFRSHNDGDSVKISLPIANIIDIEDSQIIDFADTCKIRVIDNDDTYAIDEYFFSFFSFGSKASKVLKTLVKGSAVKDGSERLPASPKANDGDRSPERSSIRNTPQAPADSDSMSSPIQLRSPFEDSVKATSTPIRSPEDPSPRTSADNTRVSSDTFRRSVDFNKIGRRGSDHSWVTKNRERGRDTSVGKRSLNRQQSHEEKPPSETQGSSDSFVHSPEETESSGALLSASEESQASASQILKGSDVFKSPTLQRSPSPSKRRDKRNTFPTGSGSQSPSRETSKSKSRLPTHEKIETATSAADSGTGLPVSAPSLQSLVRVGTYPLQRAAGFAGYLNRHSKRMSSILATESMGYVEKVSGMWKGGKKHYDDNHGLVPDDEKFDDGDDEQSGGSEARFRDHFALPVTEKLQAVYFGYLHRVLPLYGKIYIGDTSFCFRSLLPGTRTKLILPLIDIENVDKEKGFRFGYSGLVVVIKGHEELFFEFGQSDIRDDCAVTLHQHLETVRYLKDSGLLTAKEKESADVASAEHKALLEARYISNTEHDLNMLSVDEVRNEAPPIVFDDPRASILNFKPTESLRITCLTIGSRGDVQPYIALCRGLIAEGHKTRIATHVEFKSWIESHGIDFAPVDGDPAELMRICVENGMFTYSFLKEASSKFRGWIDELLSSAWQACQDSDILIESPSAMGGIHIAEALQIPYFRAFSMPWTRTRAYPHAFAVPDHKMGGAYNYITYVMFDNVFWKAIASQVNRWRKNELGLKATSLEKMQPNKVPFLYNFSPSVVVPPLDYSDWIRVTGYWFLDEGSSWSPPKDLADFIQKARNDGKKLVYVGFGSIVVQDSAALTNNVIKSVLKADVRCILSKGWSDRLDKKDAAEVEVPLPDEIFQIKSAPHDWLFAQIDAAVHHGGAGTTGASLRAGIPTIIRPFFGDQFFFGSRVEDLGVGIYLRKVNVSLFSRALWEATHSERIILRAKALGEQIRKENGVDTAIQSIYRDLEYAKSLVRGKAQASADDTNEESEESWTFIGDDNDPELVRRIHDWGTMAQSGTLSNSNVLSDSEASGSRASEDSIAAAA